MTELSPVATMSGKTNIVNGSCGLLAPNTEAKIVDLVTGEALGPGETGELCIRGPQVSNRYCSTLVWERSSKVLKEI
jgi:4-coumarate--CoA ligase